MENNKLDRLFREKLETYESLPSAQAWSSVSRQSKRTQALDLRWKAAAVAFIALGAGVMLWQRSFDRGMEIAIADHPVKPESVALVEIYVPLEQPASMSTAKAPEKSEEKVKQHPVMTLAQEVLVNTVPEIPTIALAAKKEMLALDQPRAGEMDLSLKAVGVQESLPKAAVTIRYYAENATDSLDQGDKKGLGTFLAKAQTFNPAAFLADLRTAKDDLLRSKRLN